LLSQGKRNLVGKQDQKPMSVLQSMDKPNRQGKLYSLLLRLFLCQVSMFLLDKVLGMCAKKLVLQDSNVLASKHYIQMH
jgi:hypothetical protein